MKLVETVHAKLIFDRRTQVLADRIANLLRPEDTALDIGCGDGLIDREVMAKVPGLSLRGIDIILRESPHIPVETFDGTTIPLEDDSVDVALLIDVLHHTDDPQSLLAEASRVTRRGIIVKDHLSENAMNHRVLSLMDWVGNAAYGIPLPYNYLSKARWHEMFDDLDMLPEEWNEDLGLYPGLVDRIFGGSLHFLTILTHS